MGGIGCEDDEAGKTMMEQRTEIQRDPPTITITSDTRKSQMGHEDKTRDRNCQKRKEDEAEALECLMRKAGFGFNAAANPSFRSTKQFASAKRMNAPSIPSKVQPLSSEESFNLLASQSRKRRYSASSQGKVLHLEKQRDERMRDESRFVQENRSGFSYESVIARQRNLMGGIGCNDAVGTGKSLMGQRAEIHSEPLTTTVTKDTRKNQMGHEGSKTRDQMGHEGCKEDEALQCVMKKAGFNVSANPRFRSEPFSSAKRMNAPSIPSQVKPLSSEESFKLRSHSDSSQGKLLHVEKQMDERMRDESRLVQENLCGFSYESVIARQRNLMGGIGCNDAVGTGKSLMGQRAEIPTDLLTTTVTSDTRMNQMGLEGKTGDHNCQRGREDEALQCLMKKAGFVSNVSANPSFRSRPFPSAKRMFPPSLPSKVKPLSSEESLKLFASQSRKRRQPDSSQGKLLHMEKQRENRIGAVPGVEVGNAFKIQN